MKKFTVFILMGVAICGVTGAVALADVPWLSTRKPGSERVVDQEVLALSAQMQNVRLTPTRFQTLLENLEGQGVTLTEEQFDALRQKMTDATQDLAPEEQTTLGQIRDAIAHLPPLPPPGTTGGYPLGPVVAAIVTASVEQVEGRSDVEARNSTIAEQIARYHGFVPKGPDMEANISMIAESIQSELQARYPDDPAKQAAIAEVIFQGAVADLMSPSLRIDYIQKRSASYATVDPEKLQAASAGLTGAQRGTKVVVSADWALRPGAVQALAGLKERGVDLIVAYPTEDQGTLLEALGFREAEGLRAMGTVDEVAAAKAAIPTLGRVPDLAAGSYPAIPLELAIGLILDEINRGIFPADPDQIVVVIKRLLDGVLASDDLKAVDDRYRSSVEVALAA